MLLPHDSNFLTIGDASEWFENQSEASSLLRESVVNSILANSNDDLPQNFLFLSIDQASLKLASDKRELEIISCFQLISAAEGRLKYDFKLKAESSMTSNLVKSFKATFSQKEMREVSVEADILDVWKLHHQSSDLTNLVGQFKRLMKFRHWVAHGRFWEPNRLGRVVGQYQPLLVESEISALFNHLQSLSDGFNWH